MRKLKYISKGHTNRHLRTQIEVIRNIIREHCDAFFNLYSFLIRVKNRIQTNPTLPNLAKIFTNIC